MLEIVLPFVLFVVVLIMSFFLFKTLFKILTIFAGVLILGVIVSGVLLYIDGKTYVERLPTSPILLAFADQEDIVGALEFIINQNKVQPLTQEEPIFTLLQQKEYKQIIEQGYFKVVVVQKEIVEISLEEIPLEQEEQISQSLPSLLGQTAQPGKRPKKGSPQEDEQAISPEEIEQVLQEQGIENPQMLQDPLQLKTMLYAAALMQQAQQNPEKLQQALKEEKIKVYKTTILIHILKYIPATLFSSLVQQAK